MFVEIFKSLLLELLNVHLRRDTAGKNIDFFYAVVNLEILG